MFWFEQWVAARPVVLRGQAEHLWIGRGPAQVIGGEFALSA